MMVEPRTAILPAHIEQTVEAIARLHAAHHSTATRLQRFTEDLTARAGQPIVLAWLTIAVTGWMAINVVMIDVGRWAFDPPPFAWLELLISLGALYIAILILSTQRRDDELASLREQLTLELAILSDQKAAKIIELLEELRRDHPSIRNRADPEADAMSSPADPQSVLDALKHSHQEMVNPRPSP
jgi:uncharacterized membrane protein